MAPDARAEKLMVCLGFPPFHDESYLERLRKLPGVEPLVLPIDEGGDWVTATWGCESSRGRR